MVVGAGLRACPIVYMLFAVGHRDPTLQGFWIISIIPTNSDLYKSIDICLISQKPEEKFGNNIIESFVKLWYNFRTYYESRCKNE